MSRTYRSDVRTISKSRIAAPTRELIAPMYLPAAMMDDPELMTRDGSYPTTSTAERVMERRQKRRERQQMRQHMRRNFRNVLAFEDA